MADGLTGLTGILKDLPFWAKYFAQTPIKGAGIGGALRGAGGLLTNPYAAAVGAGIGIGNIPAVKKTTQGWWGISDFETDYRDYLAGGGYLSYNQWAAAGKPGKGVKVRTPEQIKAGVAARPTQEVLDKQAADTIWKQMEATRVQREEQAWATPIPYGAKEGVITTLPDGSTGYFVRDERGYPQWMPQTGAKPTGYAAPQGNVPTDPYGRTATWDTDNAEWKYPPDWGTDPATQKAGYVSPQQQWEREEAARQAAATQAWQQQQMSYQQQQLAWQQQQATAQLEAQKQERLATLRASPSSWLEYASLAGTTPGIQPWMMPLMPQQYQGAQAGQAIPGYQAGGQTMNLPQLTTPSRQLQSRMGPTAMAQYGGYEQARTGMTPQELQFRLWGTAPPSGSYGSLQWQR